MTVCVDNNGLIVPILTNSGEPLIPNHLATLMMENWRISNGRNLPPDDPLADRVMGFPYHRPLVRLFIPESEVYWLLTEINPAEPTKAMGLTHIGAGFPPRIELLNLVDVSKRQIGNNAVQADPNFTPEFTLFQYLTIALRAYGL
jgi:hypothetical protein